MFDAVWDMKTGDPDELTLRAVTVTREFPLGHDGRPHHLLAADGQPRAARE